MQSRDLLFNVKAGAVGWLAIPFLVLFEMLGPVVETAGYLFFFTGMFFGIISAQYMWAFLFVAIGLGISSSVCAFLMEELSFHIYPKLGDVIKLLFAAIVENFGYRQLNLLWRLIGLRRWILRRARSWGEMKRSSTFGHAESSPEAPPETVLAQRDW